MFYFQWLQLRQWWAHQWNWANLATTTLRIRKIALHQAQLANFSHHHKNLGTILLLSPSKVQTLRNIPLPRKVQVILLFFRIFQRFDRYFKPQWQFFITWVLVKLDKSETKKSWNYLEYFFIYSLFSVTSTSAMVSPPMKLMLLPSKPTRMISTTSPLQVRESDLLKVD